MVNIFWSSILNYWNSTIIILSNSDLAPCCKGFGIEITSQLFAVIFLQFLVLCNWVPRWLLSMHEKFLPV